MTFGFLTEHVVVGSATTGGGFWGYQWGRELETSADPVAKSQDPINRLMVYFEYTSESRQSANSSGDFDGRGTQSGHGSVPLPFLG